MHEWEHSLHDGNQSGQCSRIPVNLPDETHSRGPKMPHFGRPGRLPPPRQRHGRWIMTTTEQLKFSVLLNDAVRCCTSVEFLHQSDHHLYDAVHRTNCAGQCQSGTAHRRFPMFTDFATRSLRGRCFVLLESVAQASARVRVTFALPGVSAVAVPVGPRVTGVVRSLHPTVRRTA